MNHHESQAKTFLLGFVFGGLVGGITALLFAPKSGKQLREDVCCAFHDLKAKTQEAIGHAGEKVKGFAEQGKETAQQVAGQAKDALKKS